MHFQTSRILDDQLDNICAGGRLSDEDRAMWAVYYGTGLGAFLMSVAAETTKPGGAKELAEAIYLGNETDLFGK